MSVELENPFSSPKTKEFCPKCNAQLNIRSSKSGSFWACSAYPECDYTRPLSSHQDVHVVKTLDDVCCPECEGDLAVKTGKFGMFIGCLNYPDCHFSVKQTDDDDYDPVDCPLCQKGQLHMRASKKGHSFYACDQYPKCDYLVNHKPVYTRCQDCDWSIMVEHHHDQLQCPNCHKISAK